MWILSGYEILRIINNQIKYNDNAPDLPVEFKKLFWKFTMVRMETAKYEFARIKNSIGNPTEIHQIDNTNTLRVGWRVYCKKSNETLDIFRVSLANDFLELFLKIKTTYQ